MGIVLVFGVFALLLALGAPVVFAMMAGTLTTTMYLGLPPILIAHQHRWYAEVDLAILRRRPSRFSW